MVRMPVMRHCGVMHLPGPLRAAVGLAATAADELKHLPDRAVELPMLAVSTALQMSLRAQQRYTKLAARGEQLMNREQPGEEPPPWATFDEPVSVDELRRAALSQLDTLIDGTDTADAAGAAADQLADLLDGQEPGNGRTTGRMFDDLFGTSDPAAGSHIPATGAGEDGPGDGATVTPITQAPGAAKTGSAPRKSARKTPRKTTTRKTATKSAPVKTAESGSAGKPTETAASTSAPGTTGPAKKTPRKAAAKKAARKAAAKSTGKSDEPAESPTSSDQPASGGKQVNKPRHTAPSKFDDADGS